MNFNEGYKLIKEVSCITHRHSRSILGCIILEASIWCLINSTSYEKAVLLAVNLGDDTDTTGAVTGGLAALYYGYDAIPDNWKRQLARKDEIESLSERLNNYYLNLNFKHKCPICGIELKKLDCWADEARFGGIVVQVLKSK